MKRFIFYYLLIFLAVVAYTVSEAHAADITLQFDPVSGAEGYRIEMSADLGATWGAAQDTGGQTTHTYTGAPEDALLLFRAVAYTSTQDAIRTYSGAWYDHRMLPLQTPSSAGIQ